MGVGVGVGGERALAACDTSYFLLPAYHLLLTTHYSLLTTFYLLLTTHYSLLTTHYWLLTTYLLCTGRRLPELAAGVSELSQR